MINVLHAEDEPQVADIVRVLCAESDPEIEIEHCSLAAVASSAWRGAASTS